MNVAYVSAMAALVGSVVGGLTSGGGTWLSDQASVRSEECPSLTRCCLSLFPKPACQIAISGHPLRHLPVRAVHASRPLQGTPHRILLTCRQIPVADVLAGQTGHARAAIWGRAAG
jgi:hypothetical protein